MREGLTCEDWVHRIEPMKTLRRIVPAVGVCLLGIGSPTEGATPSASITFSRPAPIQGDTVRVVLTLSDADSEDVLTPTLSIAGSDVTAQLSPIGWREHALLYHADISGTIAFEATVSDGVNTTQTVTNLSVAARPGATRTVHPTNPAADHTTIQTAVNASSPGDTILVEAANYVETVFLTSKGGSAAGGYLTLMAQPGVILTPPTAGSSAIYIEQQGYIHITGFEITGGSGTGSSAISITGDTRHVTVSNNRIHGFASMQFGGVINIENAFTPGHATDIVVDRNCIHSHTVVQDVAGVSLSGSAEEIDIWNNDIYDMLPVGGETVDIFDPVVGVNVSAMGIRIFGSKTTQSVRDLFVNDNLISYCAPAQSEALTLNGNVEAFKVVNNRVHDVNNIAIDFIGGEADIFSTVVPAVTLQEIIANGWVARNGLCRGNVVYRAHANYEEGVAAGIYVDGGRNMDIENNVVSQCDLGMEIAAENPGLVTSGVVVRNNLLYHNDRTGIAIGGFGTGFREQTDPGGGNSGSTQHNKIYNNTLFHNNSFGPHSPFWDTTSIPKVEFARTVFSEIWVQWALDTEIYNNLVQYADSPGVALYIDGGVDLSNTFHDNLYFASSPPPSSSFVVAERTFDAMAGTYPVTAFHTIGFPTYQSTYEATALNADPLLAAPPVGPPDSLLINFADEAADFRLQSGSPAIDRGVHVMADQQMQSDLAGNARIRSANVDLGAYEFDDTDTDGDGQTDFDEGIAGTDRHSGQSRFEIDAVTLDAVNGLTVFWNSMDSRSYRLQEWSDGAGWQFVGDRIFGDGMPLSASYPSSVARRIFRLTVRRSRNIGPPQCP